MAIIIIIAINYTTNSSSAPQGPQPGALRTRAALGRRRQRDTLKLYCCTTTRIAPRRMIVIIMLMIMLIVTLIIGMFIVIITEVIPLNYTTILLFVSRPAEC